MSKVENKINELKSEMEAIVSDSKVRLETLSSAINELNQALLRTNENEEQLNSEAGKLSNEIKLLQENISTAKGSTKEKQERVSNLGPEIKELNSKIEALQKSIEEDETKLTSLNEQNASSEKKLTDIEAEYQEKETARKALEASIDEKVNENQVKLEEAKQENVKVVEMYTVWDYLLSRIDQPEVEIMAIIASNRKISQDDIKKSAKGVSPVFVGRAISKLEADGKIVQDEEGMWDLAPSLLGVID
jgi:chromosome segregation protein